MRKFDSGLDALRVAFLAVLMLCSIIATTTHFVTAQETGHALDVSTWTKITPENASQLILLAELDVSEPNTPISFGVVGLAVSPDGRYLVVLYEDIAARPTAKPVLKVWDVESLSVKSVIPDISSSTILFSPDGEFLAIGDVPEVHLFETESFTEVQFPNKPFVGATMAFSPDEGVLAYASRTELVLWDTTLGKEYASLPPFGVSAIAFSPDGVYMAVEDVNGAIHIWSIRDEKPQDIEVLYEDREFIIVYNITFTPNGELLVIEGQQFALRLWRLKENREIAVLESADTNIFGPRLTSKPFGAVFAYLDDNLTRLINVQTGQELATLDDEVVIGINQDETIVLTSNDYVGQDFIRLRGVLTGEELKTLDPSNAYEHQFSPDGRYIVAYDSNTIYFWGVPA